MTQEKNIDIALATWNGERYLAAMLESIAAQNYPYWRLVVRDDGSSDGTAAVLESFARRFPGKTEIVKDSKGRLGAAGNFAAVAAVCVAQYVAFADQDDVWLPHKLEIAMAHMTGLEHEYGIGVPVLVHTDLRVVDEVLNQIAPSFVRHMRLDPIAGAALERLLVRNIATGCTMLCNRALIYQALPLPAEAMLHDWWFALVATCLGSVAFIDEPTVLYRQHAANAVGAGGVWTLRRWNRYMRLRERVRRRYAQARALSARVDEYLDPGARTIIDRFAQLEDQRVWRRTWNIVTQGYRDHGLIRTAICALFG